jgi:hypothetical protein
VKEHKNEFTIFKIIRHALIVLPFLHLSHPQLKVIFKAAAESSLPIIMKGEGHGDISI